MGISVLTQYVCTRINHFVVFVLTHDIYYKPQSLIPESRHPAGSSTDIGAEYVRVQCHDGNRLYNLRYGQKSLQMQTSAPVLDHGESGETITLETDDFDPADAKETLADIVRVRILSCNGSSALHMLNQQQHSRKRILFQVPQTSRPTASTIDWSRKKQSLTSCVPSIFVLYTRFKLIGKNSKAGSTLPQKTVPEPMQCALSEDTTIETDNISDPAMEEILANTVRTSILSSMFELSTPPPRLLNQYHRVRLFPPNNTLLWKKQ